jgi:hypothetical protein
MVRDASRTFILVSFGLLAFGAQARAQSPDEIRATLFALERQSHQQWLESDLAALDALMADEFHFVAMNGAVETKAEVIGSDPSVPRTPRVLQIRRLTVEPEQFYLRDGVAVVISLMHLDASIRDNTVPNRHRVLSIFTRGEGQDDWTLTARSITPLLLPPP